MRSAREARGSLIHGRAGAGLLSDISQLDGATFTAERVHPDVRDFYERTA